VSPVVRLRRVPCAIGLPVMETAGGGSALLPEPCDACARRRCRRTCRATVHTVRLDTCVAYAIGFVPHARLLSPALWMPLDVLRRLTSVSSLALEV